jgi:hypothetical protein
VVFTAQTDGTTQRWALLPAEGAVAIAERLQKEADRVKKLDADAGIARTADQRRADALVGLATGVLGPPSTGLRPQINVTVAASTLLGVDDQAAELDGYGPIPSVLARALAGDPTGTWRRLLTDEHGRLVDVTSLTYRPPAPMARLVRLQQPRCSYPGCRCRAVACELDHVIPWPEGPDHRRQPATTVPATSPSEARSRLAARQTS